MGLQVTRVTRVTPVTSCLFFIGKMLLIIYNIIKLLYIAQFPKKNTRGVTEVTGVTGVTRGMIARNPDQ